MRSIKRRFDKISEKNQYLSSLICFKKAIEGQNFKKRTIRFWFKQLVENDEYSPKDKKVILRDLENSKPP
jgi:hypothetical protein